MAHIIPLVICPEPTYRMTHLLRRYLDPDYVFPEGFSTEVQSAAEVYAWDLILGTNAGLDNIPQSDMEKYLHCMIGGSVDKMPDSNASELNYYMNKALEEIKKMNDLLCNSCIHKEVCSLKETFQEAQNAVNGVEVVYNDQDKSTRITRLGTLNWIEPVKLQCKHYSSDLTYRATGQNII